MRPLTMTMAMLLAVAATSPAAAAGSQALFTDSRMVVLPRLSVEIVGSGPDIVLIPGLASSRATWRATAERLRGQYRLHLVQIAGFAGEPARANASGAVFDPVLADLDRYMVALKSPPIVMGHSMGGALALALAERHPTHLAKLLIVDALPFYGVLIGGPAATAASVTPMADMMRASRAPMPEPQLQAMMAMMVTAPADVDRVVGWSHASDAAVVGQAMGDDVTTDLRADLGKVTVPTMVLYETVLAPAMTAGYAPLRNKTLVPVPDAKHFIMFDQPARFATEVDAFLARDKADERSTAVR